MAGMLGNSDIDIEIVAMIKLEIPANKKLADGVRSKLAATIGIENTKSDRPFATSLGVSLKTREMVSSIKKNNTANEPDFLLIKYVTIPTIRALTLATKMRLISTDGHK